MAPAHAGCGAAGHFLAASRHRFLLCRKLRLGNKKIQEEVVNVSGGIEFLQAAGFQLVFDDADG